MDNLFNNVNKLCKDIENISNISIIERKDISINYEIPTLLKAINNALLSNEFLSQNAFLHQFDISYNSGLDSNDNLIITTMQRFQMMVLLNRETTIKKKNSKIWKKNQKSFGKFKDKKKE